MCFICDRIEMIKSGTNPYFVKETDIGIRLMKELSIGKRNG